MEFNWQQARRAREEGCGMSRRLTVLVQAYACNPKYGSEEGVGWGWVTAISEHHDLHVLTAAYHEADLEAALESAPQLRERVRFHYIPQRAWHYRPTPIWKRIEESIMKPVMLAAYRSWQRDAYKFAKKLSASTKFDLVHVITYVGFRFPGQFWKLPLPLVWGPIGGLENTPWRYLSALTKTGALKFAGRNVINTLHKLLLPEPKKAFRKAEGGVIAATSRISEEIRKSYGVDSVVRCEIGAVAQTDSAELSQRQDGAPLKIVWSALHADFKALPLLLQALATLPRTVNWTLTVLGSGPLTNKWQELATSLGVADRVDWIGRVSRDAAISRMAECHVMVVTSLHDLTSSVLIEALCVGLPVICPDHYGFRDAIDDSCGFRVATTSLSDISQGIANALVTLHDDEVRRRRLSHGALERSELYGWDQTGKHVSEIYESIIE
jgi:glycosyltransferase involved in cell wall biosynthesis